MSPKMGRPKSKNPKNISLNLRLSREDAEMIQECADILETSRTNVIMMGVRKIRSEIKEK